MYWEVGPVAHDEERNNEQNGIEHFRCYHFAYTTYSKHGIAVNIGMRHKELQKPEILHEEVPLTRKLLRCTFSQKQFP